MRKFFVVLVWVMGLGLAGQRIFLVGKLSFKRIA